MSAQCAVARAVASCRMTGGRRRRRALTEWPKFAHSSWPSGACGTGGGRRRLCIQAYPSNPPCRPLTATLSRRHLVRQWHGLWLASGRVLEAEFVDLAARRGLRVVVRELFAPLFDLEAGKGRVVLEPNDDLLLEVAWASVPHLSRLSVNLKEAN